MLDKRNEAICRRFYYWTEIQRLRFDDALRILSQDEFFIGEDYLMRIIRENASKITDIEIKSVPKVRKPKLSAVQMELLDFQ